MSKKDEDPETSHWKTISAEELAAARRLAARERLAGPKDRLAGLIGVLGDELESDLADGSLEPLLSEIAETNLETLRNQAPALIHLLDQLPSSSRDGAFSMMLHLLLAVRGRKEFSKKYSRKVQAEKAREGKAEPAAERDKVIIKYVHLPWKEAEVPMNAELEKKRLRIMSRTAFYERQKAYKSHS